MSLLVAVKSCNQHRDLGHHNVIRETWGKSLDVKFFLGGGMGKNEPDELRLDCPDDYHSLPLKTREICKWAMGKKVDHLFICDTDSYVIPSKLLTCGYEQYDYAGKIDREFGVPFAYQAVD